MKKKFTNPERKDLFKGNVLPIYSDFMEETGYMGNALLINHQPSKWRDERKGFIKAILGEETDNSKNHYIMWKAQRWLVEFVDGPLKGHRTHRYIGYFYKFGGLDLNEDE